MNAASRVANILGEMIRVHRINNKQPRLDDVLVLVFNISGKEQDDLLTAYLTLFRQQIALVESLLEKKSCPKTLYKRQLDFLEESFSIRKLYTEWDGIKLRLNQDVKLAVDWMAWYLDDDEPEVDSVAIQKLIDDLNDLEVSLCEVDLDDETALLIKAQIEIVRSLLSKSFITGFDPVLGSVRAAYGVLQTQPISEERLSNEKNKPFFRKFNSVFWKIVETTGKVEGFVSICERGTRLGAQALEFFSDKI